MIHLICKINDPIAMIEMNKNNMYLLFNIGNKKIHEEDDEIGRQLANLKTVNYKFNINEIFIFRTFLDNMAIIYKIMENELYILNSTKKILSIVSYIDNYIIIFYENNIMEVIYLKNFKYIEIHRNTHHPEDYLSLLFKIIEEDLLQETKKVRTNINPMLLASSKVQDFLPSKVDITVNKDSLNIIAERIWHIFALQEENTSLCFSVIENNTRIFKYLVNINKENILFENIFELITFLNTEFYEKIKLCSYLI